jgi:hypothetical protein
MCFFDYKMVFLEVNYFLGNTMTNDNVVFKITSLEEYEKAVRVLARKK